ncbi:protein kinase [uncultured Tateyamaria sp.]|uniref:protein kinase domain-containing protein n=1 Tax=uncultured Tateyamaria sp. TaxID=455651 RepID=UPI00260DA3DE|nr:protein kinase [uncultured Tateyamaria sp.]
MASIERTTPSRVEAYLEHLPGLRATGFQTHQVVTDRRGVALLRGRLPDRTEAALKVVSPEAQPSGPYDPMEMLQRETKWLCKYGSELAQGSYISDGLARGEHWLLMAWQRGEPIDRWHRTSSGSVDGLRKVYLAAAKSIARLHSAGQVHGDLQPSHLLVDGGNVGLIDFALSHAPGAFNYRGALVHFMAPETAGMLLQRVNLVVNPLSEVYSFGAVLFFAATGKIPTAYGNPKAPIQDKLSAIAELGFTRTDLLTGTLPVELSEVILDCLQKRPGDRIASLDEFTERLSGCAQ